MGVMRDIQAEDDLPPLVVTSFDHLNFLVVDDDTNYLDLMGALLKSASVGGINKAQSAAAAVAILTDPQSTTNCVICDHHMEGMTGLALLQRIRAGGRAIVPRDLRFIMVSSDSNAELVRAAVQLDVNGFITKPVSKNAVLRGIHLAFGRPFQLKPVTHYSRVVLPGEAKVAAFAH